MGYKYQNKLDQENEEAYWRGKPRWQRRCVAAAKVLFACTIALLGIAATFSPLWQIIAKAMR